MSDRMLAVVLVHLDGESFAIGEVLAGCIAESNTVHLHTGWRATRRFG